MKEDIDLTGVILAGRYRISGLIGSGGMGTVYAGEHVEMGRHLAVKVLRSEVTLSPTLVERFKREARAASSIEHENIVDCIDVGSTDSGLIYYVMERLRGEDLQKHLRRDKTLSWPRAQAIALQICRALAAAHAKGVVHRDLKPGNIFLTQRDDHADFVKVVDFGIAKITAPGADDDALTALGEVLGTTPYMAPEQAAGESVDHRVDIYATGVILFQMLSGSLPFAGKTPRQVLAAILTGEVPAFAARNPGLDASPELEALLRRCMHRDREQRFPDMNALHAALARLPSDACRVSRITRITQTTQVPASTGDPAVADSGQYVSVSSYELVLSGRVTSADLVVPTPTVTPAPDGAAPMASERRTQAFHGFEPAARPGATEHARAVAEHPTRGHGSIAGSQRDECFAGSELLPPGRVLAVLPFRGGELGEAIADELVDVLARTRGLRVLGTGATARFRDDRDPLALGRALGAVAVIDGTVQLQGSRVRVRVRLLDATTGLQLWSDQQEGQLNDLFAFQESSAQRIAEELRLEMTTLTQHPQTSPEVVDAYLAARRAVRRNEADAVRSAVTALQRCLLAAPEFRPAIALLALAGVRAGFLSFGAPHAGSLSREELRAIVERALAETPDLAESHVAAGILAVHEGGLHAAVCHLRRALDIAPTCADAHEFLGVLQCEAGRAEEGVRRIKLASILAPDLPYAPLFLARERGLAGDQDGAHVLLDELDRHGLRASTQAVRLRMALWRGDLAMVRKFAEVLPPGAPRMFAEAAVMADPERRAELLDGLVARSGNARYRSLLHQLAVEVHVTHGEVAVAERHLGQAADEVLVDLAWLDRCPLLAPLRDGPAFAAARQKVELRASALWLVP